MLTQNEVKKAVASLVDEAYNYQFHGAHRKEKLSYFYLTRLPVHEMVEQMYENADVDVTGWRDAFETNYWFCVNSVKKALEDLGYKVFDNKYPVNYDGERLAPYHGGVCALVICPEFKAYCLHKK